MLSSKKYMIIFATSINQVNFVEDVLKQKYFDSSIEKVLLLADPTMYNEIVNEAYKKYISENSDVFDKKYYINEIFEYKNINQNFDNIKLASFLESQGVSIGDVNYLLIGLLSTAFYVNITKLFYNSKIRIYSDGMMSFGPLRGDVYENNLAARIDKIYYEDLCGEVVPNYLPELKIKPELVLCDIDGINGGAVNNKTLLIALQSLSYSRILSENEEYEFYVKYIKQIVRIFHGYKVYVLPHPNNSSELLNGMSIDGVEILDNKYSGEEYIKKFGITFVTSCFSTLMFRAKKMGASCFSFGVNELLLRLIPYENSNRVPLILSKYYFHQFNDISDVSSQKDFIRNIKEYKTNAIFLQKILNAVSVLVKPSLISVIDVDGFSIFNEISDYDKGVLIAQCSTLKCCNFPCKIKNIKFNVEENLVKQKTAIENKKSNEIDALKTELVKLRTDLKTEKEKREKIKNSLSWRLTAPIRFLGRIIK